MQGNIFKDKTRTGAKEKSSSNWLDNVLSGRFFVQDAVKENVPFAFFVFVLLLAYLIYDFQAEKTLVDIHRKEIVLRDLRLKHLALQAQLAREKLQSKVAQKTYSLGLKEMTEPARKIHE